MSWISFIVKLCSLLCWILLHHRQHKESAAIHRFARKFGRNWESCVEHVTTKSLKLNNRAVCEQFPPLTQTGISLMHLSLEISVQLSDFTLKAYSFFPQFIPHLSALSAFLRLHYFPLS